MGRGEARQHAQGRWFQCLTPARQGAAAVPVECTKKGGALVVLGAGSRNFNGVYLFEGALEGNWTEGDRYCKRNGTEVLTYYSGWWLFTADGLGDSCYGAQLNSAAGAAPPQRGWCVKHGIEPAPRAELFGSLEDVPLELQGADADESCALEVRGAGSAEFDGVYRLCGLHQGKCCYRKDDGDQTIICHRGWWMMNKNGCGESAYGLRCDTPTVMPPSGAAWGFKKAQAPAPSVRLHVDQEGAAVVSALASGLRAASPAPASLGSGLHSSNARSLEESVEPQACEEDGSWASPSASGTPNKEDGSLASTSASGTVNKEDGFLTSASGNGTANHEAESPRQHAVNVSLSSGTIVLAQDLIACEPAVVSVVASVARAASPASTLRASVLQSLNARRLDESVDPQAFTEDGSLASTSVSGTVNKEDGSLASTSASETVNNGEGSLASTSASQTVNNTDGSLASTSAGGTVHETGWDAEQAVISKADGRDVHVPDDAAVEHQVVFEAPLVPTLNKKPPRAGLVSQRLTEFAKLSQGMPARSFAAEERMPDRGLVSQRIQQHQEFINQT